MANKDIILEEFKKQVKDFFDHSHETFIPGKTKVGVGAPIYNEEEVISLLDSLLNLRISQGVKVSLFEKEYSKYIGTKFGVGMNSGSSANLLALNALMEMGVKPGSEVICPAATFATVAMPIVQLGLIPVFVDVDLNSYNLSVEEIKKALSDKTAILMPVHSMGNACKMDEIIEIAKDNDLKILEDCCESHGCEHKGKKVGSMGDMGTYSFFVAHNITTGEGGIVVTNNDEYEDVLRSLREFGRVKQSADRFGMQDKLFSGYDRRYIFKTIGFNVRMTDLAASLGLAQLKKLDGFNKIREDNVKFFNDELSEYEEFLALPTFEKGNYHSNYGYTLTIKENAPFNRQQLTSFLENNNIETRPFMAGCLPDQPAFRNRHDIRIVGDLANSRIIRERTFFIGCHPGIDDVKRRYIIDTIKRFIKSI